MKRTFFLNLFAAAVLLSSCKKEEYRAPSITGIAADTIVLNIGDRIVLAPNVKNLKGNSYAWLVNGQATASGQLSYTFEATASGNFEVTFKVDNKGGTDKQSFNIYVEKPIELTIADQLEVSMGKVLEISPTVNGPAGNDFTYQWSIGDSVIGRQRILNFISPAAGTYELKFRAVAGKQTATATRKIVVKPEQYVQNAYMVLEYAPAPAKNHNWAIIGNAEFWKFGHEFQLPYNDFLAKATAMRRDNVAPSLVIGSWGGYAVFRFDHTVANAAGKPDLELTATCSRLDLPAVYVAYDRNKNGKPDEEEWYEIKNEDYGLEDMPDYAITFTYNKTETDAKRIYTYYNWKDNQETPAQGEMLTNKTFTSAMTDAGTFSSRGFFPGLSMTDIPNKKVAILDGWQNTFTRKGKRITKNLTGAPPFSQKLNIDIDLAVNSRGERVQLPGIDFVKVRKVVYPVQQDFINAGGQVVDYNMDETRMLHVGAILDKHLIK
ncbi:PKD-like domain-containing protein [Chitinophaga jiangningensis]|uniref:PKD-like domain-containing protein n=1 Tax=Chitinophaga jiangningensis TaxID=1419482 RepID=A0A1M7IRI7_9BACT|nr:PKD-like domain-containing protein [Chitinophaga jiangningensis]SHM43299.1 PKD-like domain-containing protein [Chitinophaga jiangningensis]